MTNNKSHHNTYRRKKTHIKRNVILIMFIIIVGVMFIPLSEAIRNTTNISNNIGLTEKCIPPDVRSINWNIPENRNLSYVDFVNRYCGDK